MPELPEVEIVGRNLRSWCSGERLQSVQLLDERLAKTTEETPASLSDLVGRRLSTVRRRAKHLVLDFEGEALLCHFRMTGKLVRIADPPPRFVRLVLRFDGGTTVGFKDPRCLGTVRRLATDRVDAFFEQRRLGPDPWPGPRDGPWWQARYAGCRSPLKPALMLQERVAGLGNIVAAEVCWTSGLDPRRPVTTLVTSDWDRIAKATTTVIERTLEAEDGPEVRYVGEGGRSGATPFAVYGREGQACRRCGGPVARFRQNGRSTFWCEACQGG